MFERRIGIFLSIVKRRGRAPDTTDVGQLNVLPIDWRIHRRVTTGGLQRASQHELDLRIEAAQIVVRPPLHGVQQLAINTEQERLAIRHVGFALLVERAGVHHGLRIPIRAQHHQQVAHHRGFPLLIQLNDLL